MAHTRLYLTSNLYSVAEEVGQRVLKQTKNKKLVFIPTAAEGEKGDKSWLEEDRQALFAAGFEVLDFSITDRTQEQVAAVLEGVGSVCVGGGNTYYLLEKIRQSGFDQLVPQLVKKGLIYIGSSAGSIVAGPSIETSLDDRKITPNLTDYAGLNLTDISVRPHWGSDHFRKKYLKEMPRLYSLPYKFVLLNDQQFLSIEDEWSQIIEVEVEADEVS